MTQTGLTPYTEESWLIYHLKLPKSFPNTVCSILSSWHILSIGQVSSYCTLWYFTKWDTSILILKHDESQNQIEKKKKRLVFGPELSSINILKKEIMFYSSVAYIHSHSLAHHVESTGWILNWNVFLSFLLFLISQILFFCGSCLLIIDK